jgi:lipoprotein-releasing system permease protein
MGSARVDATRLAALSLLVRRLVRRSSPPGPIVAVARSVGAGLTLVGTLGLVLQVGTVAAVVAFGVGTLAWMAAEVGRRITPAIAVSVIGIALGVASLFTVRAVMNGFEREVVERSARVNGHILLTKYGLDFYEYAEVAGRVRARPGVVGASPIAVGAVAIAKVDESVDGADAHPVVALLKGVHPAWVPSLGSFESVLDAPVDEALRPGHLQRPPGLVVGVGLARRLGLAVGDPVAVVTASAVSGALTADGPPRAGRFEVTALMDSGVAELDREFALAHLSAAQFVLFGAPRVTGIELALASIDGAREEAEAIADALNSGPNRLYRAHSWLDANTTLVMLRQVGQIVGLIVGLIVVVAATTLIGGLLLVVRSRIDEIAILATIGADRRLVLGVFEGLGLLAGILGVGLGLALGGAYCLVISRWSLGIDAAVYPIDVLPVAPTWGDAAGPALVALVVCALASGPAALVAARIRPMVALRG